MSNATPIRLFIGTPAYGHQVTVGYLKSMLSLVEVLRQNKIASHLFAFGNESLVTRARNSIVAHFLGNKDFTHLLFIDADIIFSPQTVLRLLQKNVEVVGGCYPKKGINWEKVREQVPKEKDDLKLLAKSLDYVMSFATDNESKFNATIEKDGFTKVTKIGTGFLLIQRSAFEKMIKAYPEGKYINQLKGYSDPKVMDYFYTFFDTMVEPENRNYLSEDYAFCYKWLKTGGEIWMDTLSPLGHHGSIDFRGSISDVIQDLKGLEKL